MSADKHIVNIWDASTAQNMTSLQPQEPGINDVLQWKDSGLIMLGLDAPRIQAWPYMHGPADAPFWHAFPEQSSTPALITSTQHGACCNGAKRRSVDRA